MLKLNILVDKNALYPNGNVTMKGNAQKSQKSHVFTTVSSESFKDSKESGKSNSSRNAGFLGFLGAYHNAKTARNASFQHSNATVSLYTKKEEDKKGVKDNNKSGMLKTGKTGITGIMAMSQ